MLSAVFLGSPFQQVVQAFLFMVEVPFHSKMMMWACLPIFANLLIMKLYFGIYRKEALGWNSVIANAMTLVWVGVSSMRYILERNFLNFDDTKTILALSMLVIGLLIICVSFIHGLPEGFMYSVVSSQTIQFFSYMCVLFIYANMPFTYISAIAAGLLFVVIWLVFLAVRLFEPSK